MANKPGIKLFIVAQAPPEGGIGYWAFCLSAGDRDVVDAGGVPQTTAYRCYLEALYAALERIKQPCVVRIVLDDLVVAKWVTNRQWLEVSEAETRIKKKVREILALVDAQGIDLEYRIVEDKLFRQQLLCHKAIEEAINSSILVNGENNRQGEYDDADAPF